MFKTAVKTSYLAASKIEIGNLVYSTINLDFPSAKSYLYLYFSNKLINSRRNFSWYSAINSSEGLVTFGTDIGFPT